MRAKPPQFPIERELGREVATPKQVKSILGFGNEGHRSRLASGSGLIESPFLDRGPVGQHCVMCVWCVVRRRGSKHMLIDESEKMYLL